MTTKIKCITCGKKITVNPSGKVRRHKNNDARTCWRSGTKPVVA